MELIKECPECGSGDVRFCTISVRPYCNECKYWAPVNFGTAEEAIERWNKRLKPTGLWATLTDEQRAAALAYTGPDTHGEHITEVRTMQSRDFCYWLQGFFEIAKPVHLTPDQVLMIQRHLNMVFIHEIDPSFPKEQQAALNEAHKPTTQPKGTTHLDQTTTLVRC